MKSTKSPIRLSLSKESTEVIMASIEIQPPRKPSKLELVIDALQLVVQIAILISLAVLIYMLRHGESPVKVVVL